MAFELPEGLSTGKRIRILRERRGLSRAVLAELVGRSPDWLKRIETGKRNCHSVTLLVRLATALRVDDVALLTGDELLIPVDAGKPSFPGVAAIREAIRATSFAADPGSLVPCTPQDLQRRVTQAWLLWHSSCHHRTEVGALLPGLIRDAHACIRAHSGADRRTAHAATGDLYRLVQRTIAHVCEPELWWVAIDRDRNHSEEADQPLALALAAWSTAIGQRAGGFAEEAVRTDEAGMAILRPWLDTGDRDITATYGALQLQAATSAGLDGQSGDALRYLDQAAATARRLPATYSHPQTAFGTANVDVQRVSVGVGLVNPGEALHQAENIDPGGISSLERRSRLLLDIGAAYQQKREPAAAIQYLSAAHNTAPEAIRYTPMARGLAYNLARTTKGPLKTDAVKLAEAIGIGTD